MNWDYTGHKSDMKENEEKSIFTTSKIKKSPIVGDFFYTKRNDISAIHIQQNTAIFFSVIPSFRMIVP